MHPVTRNPNFLELLILLSDKREQLDEETEKHPSAENIAKANSVRLAMMQVGRILFRSSVERIWN